MYGLETLYVQSTRHVIIIEKFWKGYVKSSWFSHDICILIGSTTLKSLMFNRLFDVELWRHNRRKSTICSTMHIQDDLLFVWHVLLLRSSWNFTSRYVPSFEMTSSLLTKLWRQRLSDMTSKFDEVISPSKLSTLFWNFLDFLTLL